jgi:hypothetical protein
VDPDSNRLADPDSCKPKLTPKKEKKGKKEKFHV